jgi:hypothetical protein
MMYFLLYCLYAFGQAIFTERVLEENPKDRDAGAVLCMALTAPMVTVILLMALFVFSLDMALGKKE